jgi:hypothetical protein
VAPVRAQSAQVFHIRTLEVAARLDITRQLTEICFYLGALATWKYI